MDQDELVYQIFCQVTEIVYRLGPAQRWQLVLPEDRWSLSKEIADKAEPGDDAAAARLRWYEQWEKDNLTEYTEELFKATWLPPGDDLPATPLNLYLILKYHPKARGAFRWNDYAKRLESTAAKKSDPVSYLQRWFEKKLKVAFKREDIGHQLTDVAMENEFNPLHNYLLGLEWDRRKSRIDMLLITYAGAEDTPHNRRISRRLLLGAVARALPVECWCTDEGREMGAKFDNIVILEGAQGEKKSSFWEVLGRRFYAASNVNVADKDSKMLAAYTWFWDCPELASFKKAETEAIKAFTSMRADTYRAPYGRGIETTPRHCIMVGSTNEEQYLPDHTGNRRYWPVRCGTIDLSALMRDVDQIWAEAVHVFLAEMDCADCHASQDTVPGQRPRCAEHRWWLSTEEEAEAKAVAELRREEVPLTEMIRDWWLAKEPSNRQQELTWTDVAEFALGITVEHIASSAKALQTQIGYAMKELGFKKAQHNSGSRKRYYVPSEELKCAPKVERSMFSGGGRQPPSRVPVGPN